MISNRPRRDAPGPGGDSQGRLYDRKRTPFSSLAFFRLHDVPSGRNIWKNPQNPDPAPPGDAEKQGASGDPPDNHWIGRGDIRPSRDQRGFFNTESKDGRDAVVFTLVRSPTDPSPAHSPGESSVCLSGVSPISSTTTGHFRWSWCLMAPGVWMAPGVQINSPGR